MWLTVMIVAAAGLLAPAAASAASGLIPANNLTSNPSFETLPLSTWTGSNSMITQVASASAPDGSSVAEVTAVSSAPLYSIDQYPSTTGNISAGVTYLAGASVESANSGTSGSFNKDVALVIRESTPGGTIVGENSSSQVPLDSSYQRLTTSYVAQATGDVIDVYVVQFNPASGDAMYVDAVTLSQPALIPSGNLTSNPSFESGTTGWAPGGGAGATLSSVTAASAPDGTHAANVTWTSGGIYSLDQYPSGSSSITAGTTYEGGAAVASASTSSVGKTVQLVIREWSGATIVGESSGGTAVLTSSYQQLSTTYTAQRSGDTIDIYVVQLGAGAGNAFDVDAVTLAPTTNVGFEDGTVDGWAPDQGSSSDTATNSTSQHDGGSHSLMLHVAPPSSGTIDSFKTSTSLSGLMAGTQITYQVYTPVEIAGAMEPPVSVQPYSVDANGNISLDGSATLAQGTWTPVTWTLPDTSNPVASVGLQILDGNGFTGNLYVDAITSGTPGVSTSVNLSSPSVKSGLAPGVSLDDTSLVSGAGAANAKSTLYSATSYMDVPIMGWGQSDPWPVQSGGYDWSTLDPKMKIAAATGETPVITLADAPYWMVGQLQANGSTKLFTGDFQSGWDAARILDNQMANWKKLVTAVAERYMAAPYNVRNFEVWNELKGYWNPSANNWDYTTSAGNPSQPIATSGYTYMYNQAYAALQAAATADGVSWSSISVGGPYIVTNSWSNANTESNPSTFTEPYGNFDQRALAVVQYWLQHKTGGNFVAVDGNTTNQDSVNLTDEFTASQKFGDVAKYINSTYGNTLPVWWAEWYANPYTGSTPATEPEDAAIKSYAISYLLQTGISTVPMSWGQQGYWYEGNAGGSFYTDTANANGGAQLAWAADAQYFKTDFASGTQTYTTTVSSHSQVAALSSSTHVMLINKTNNFVSVALDGRPVVLTPYQVLVTNP